MNEEQIRQLIQEELQKNQYNVARIPFHTHNGVDSPIVKTVSQSGGVIGPASNTDGYIPQWNGANSNILKNGVLLDTDGALAGNSDSAIATQKATKTYADTKIASSILTTKGDLLTYSSSLQRLGVGSNNQVLTADSTQADGIKWATPATSSTPQSALFAAACSIGVGLGPVTVTVSPGFKPLMVVGICEGGAINGSVTGIHSFFTGGPNSNGYSLIINVDGGSADNTFNSRIGEFVDANGTQQVLLANFTSTSFDVSFQRSNGTNNSGGNVYGVVMGY